MGGTAIGPTNAEINALPIQSPSSVYDLRNANAALSPQALPPPPGPVESPPPSAYQLPPEAFSNPPQFSQPGPFDRLQVQPVQPQQFQQPQFAPTTADMQQQNQARGHGVMRHLMTSFLDGMGRAMMAHAGIETPEQEQQRQFENAIAQQNAQANLGLKALEAEKYKMQIATVPIVNEYGVREDVPQWRADARIQEVNRFHEAQLRAQEARDRMSPEAQLYASYKAQGLTDEQASQKLNAMNAAGRAPTEVSLALATAHGDPEAALKRLDKSKRESRPINQFQMPSGVSAEAAATGGEAVLRNLDPGKAQSVRKIANYELDPTKVTSTRSGERAQVMGLVSLYDKTYDQKLYPARSKVQLDFTSGKTADNITALNTAADHLSQLHDAGVALQNGDIQALNLIANAYRVQTGGSAPVVFDAIKNAVAGELEKAFKGASATDVGTANVLNTIRTNASPEQITAVAATDIHLMKSRLKALEQRYQNGMGKPAPAGLITYPNSQEIFSRIGQTPQSATNPANGHKIVVREGRWVDAQTGAPI